MFEWDEAKRLTNLAKHGLDFLQAERLFDGRALLTVPARGFNEPRFVSVGEVETIIVTVVWTWRGPNRRLISVRRARREEREAYGDVLGR